MGTGKALLVYSLRLVLPMLLAALLLGCGPTAQTALRLLRNPDTTGASAAAVPAPAETGRVAALREGLQTAGYTLNRGSTRVVYPLALVDQGVLSSAGGNNHGQPYKVFQVPLFGAEIEKKEVRDLAPFKLQPHEAIVYVGPTPPQVDYFSYIPFLWVRHTDSIVPKGDWLFASIGDPINNAVIATEGDGEPFQQETVLVFTADQGIYEHIASIAEAAGYPATMINVAVIPASLTHLGLQRESDSLLILVRTGNFVDQSARDAYLADDYYGTVYRVTPKEIPALQPYPPVPLRERNWQHEAELAPDLEAGLARLEAAILAQTPSQEAKSFGSIRWFYDSADVLADDPASPAYRQFVAGESPDTPYLRTATADGLPANFELGANDMVVVYGVNHAATGLATYSSFGVYGDWLLSSCDPAGGMADYLFGCGNSIWNGIGSMTSHNFTGSAETYLPGDPVAPYLYAVRVVRGSCPADDPYCVVVVEPSTPGSADGIPLERPALIGYRAYLNPVTHGGPAYEDIIPDRAIWFAGE